jgi:hypothetical protein
MPDAAADTPWSMGRHTAPSAAEEAIHRPAAGDVSLPLSEAQIDQILDALDERLALIMLRTYGR